MIFTKTSDNTPGTPSNCSIGSDVLCFIGENPGCEKSQPGFLLGKDCGSTKKEPPEINRTARQIQFLISLLVSHFILARSAVVSCCGLVWLVHSIWSGLPGATRSSNCDSTSSMLSTLLSCGPKVLKSFAQFTLYSFTSALRFSAMVATVSEVGFTPATKCVPT